VQVPMHIRASSDNPRKNLACDPGISWVGATIQDAATQNGIACSDQPRMSIR
jgi:hypothetical protein